MKKIMILPIAILLLTTIVQAISVTNFDANTDTQIRLMEESIAYSYNNNLIFRNEDGIIRNILMASGYASQFAKLGVTEENTNNLYLVCLAQTLCIYDYDQNLATTQSIAGLGLTNPVILAVTENYYLFTSDTWDDIKVVYKNNLTIKNTVSNLPTGGSQLFFHCNRNTYLPISPPTQTKTYCNTPHYVNNQIVIPYSYNQQPGITQRLGFLVLEENLTGVSYVSNVRIDRGIEDMPQYNDICVVSEIYDSSTGIPNEFFVNCPTGGDFYTYRVKSGILSRPPYINGETRQVQQLYDDITFTMYGDAPIGDKYLDVYYTGDPLTITDDELLYSGSALRVQRDSSSGGKYLEGNYYFIDYAGQGKQADINDIYQTELNVFLKRYSSSLLYDHSLDETNYLRYYENGTTPQIEFPYDIDPVIEINYPEEVIQGIYQFSNQKSVIGSQPILKIISQMDTTLGLSPYIGIDCDTTYKVNKLEKWDGEASDITANYGIINPYARTAFDNSIITSFNDSTGLQGLILSKNATENMDYSVSSYSTTVNSFAQDLYITDNLDLQITLTDKQDVIQLELHIDTTSEFIEVTLNDVELIKQPKINYIDRVFNVVFTIYEDKIIYNLNEQKFGSIGGLYSLPLRTIYWDVTTNNETFFILGSWAMFDDGLYPQMLRGDNIGNDQFNNTYYFNTCDYTEHKDEKVTTKLYYSYVPDDYQNIITFTYEYDSYSEDFLEETGAIVDVDEQSNNIQAKVCETLGVCNEGERLILAIFLVIALTFGAYSYMEKNYQATLMSELVPVAVFVMTFVLFAVYGFFPGWFTTLAIIGVAVVIATKFSLFRAFTGRGGNTGEF